MNDARYIDPRPCDECTAQVELQDSIYTATIDAHTLDIDLTQRYCSPCAHKAIARQRTRPVEHRALKTAEILLDRRFGEPVRVYWIQGDEHRWLVLCRRLRRLNP